MQKCDYGQDVAVSTVAPFERSDLEAKARYHSPMPQVLTLTNLNSKIARMSATIMPTCKGRLSNSSETAMLFARKFIPLESCDTRSSSKSNNHFQFELGSIVDTNTANVENFRLLSCDFFSDFGSASRDKWC